MLKKISLILILLLLLFSCRKKDRLEIEEVDSAELQSVKEETVELTNDENKPVIMLSRNDTVTIRVRADGAPGMYLGEDDDVHGFYVDLERMIMEEMGQAHIFTSYTDVGPIVQELKTGTSHIALAVPLLPDFQSFLNLSIPFENLNYVTFIRNGNRDIKGSSKEEVIRSLHGKRVGVQTQGHIYQMLRDEKEIELVEFPTTTKAMEALNNGIVDAVPENRETGYYYAELNNWDVKSLEGILLSYKITTGFSKIYDLDLAQRYNKALRTLMDNGRVQRLRESYYGEAAEEYKPE